MPQVVVLKCQTLPGNIAQLAACFALLCAAACADPEVGTLVRFQGGKPGTSWNLESLGDASTDAARDSGDPLDATVDALDASPPDEGDEDAGSSAAADGGAQTKAISACTLQLTTRAQGGRYAPKNIGAIWVERADGAWVKTLKVWAGVRLRYLKTYLAANTLRDTTDAMTSATLRQHTTHEASWNLRDAQGKVATDGDYRVRVEVTDRSGDGQLLTIPFSKSADALTISPDDSEFFVDVALSCN